MKDIQFQAIKFYQNDKRKYCQNELNDQQILYFFKLKINFIVVLKKIFQFIRYERHKMQNTTVAFQINLSFLQQQIWFLIKQIYNNKKDQRKNIQFFRKKGQQNIE
ncbi:hypothetical protein TTHERM_000243899 (macronuclear) [Tetrahymena thermophila SB210]|uniref:Uncharacterized protein n=1 Tax=Tetrahymena thermophila (strain SB210) TaxID=312017 RepID=W7X3N1_TETTS|nr:hypothetical protein TTHERM_000243899 [Tetrahymena thermophila SB210]EWS72062.1 hypothetical protein TTHERM_000243899 [Tetrahymena thermophila SB210]|eukprot:XP_012655373.1 hypothetical protein TTHERM_000243899 [Tetrahymena thermophila SB210]